MGRPDQGGGRAFPARPGWETARGTSAAPCGTMRPVRDCDRRRSRTGWRRRTPGPEKASACPKCGCPIEISIEKVRDSKKRNIKKVAFIGIITLLGLASALSIAILGENVNDLNVLSQIEVIPILLILVASLILIILFLCIFLYSTKKTYLCR